MNIPPLELIFNNCDFDIEIIQKCSLICKNFHEQIKVLSNYIKFKNFQYTSNNINKCNICNKKYKLTTFKCCYSCIKNNLISFTAIKNKYGLDENDLKNFEFYEKHAYSRFYNHSEIKTYLFFKYPFSVLKYINLNINLNNRNLKNIEKIEKFNIKCSINLTKWIWDNKKELFKKSNEKIKNIIKNIITFDKTIEENNLNEKIKNYNININSIRNQFIDYEINIDKIILDEIIIKIEEIVKKEILVKERTEKLKLRLKNIGLQLRSDSKTCEQYINSKREDIENVIEIAQEMDYLYNHTNYSNNLQKIINKNTQYIDDESDEYESDDSNYSRRYYTKYFKIPIEECILQAKKETVQNIPKDNLPIYMYKYK